MSAFRDAAPEQLLWHTTEIQNVLCNKILVTLSVELQPSPCCDGVNKTMEKILKTMAFL